MIVSALAMHRRFAAMPYFEHDSDPKRPRRILVAEPEAEPVGTAKKRTGWLERGESRKDEGREHHRHVHVRC